jgi:hypothetical protein
MSPEPFIGFADRRGTGRPWVPALLPTAAAPRGRSATATVRQLGGSPVAAPPSRGSEAYAAAAAAGSLAIGGLSAASRSIGVTRSRPRPSAS